MNNQKKDETEIGRKNFCLISIDIDYIEWLYLAFTGNRRAYFKLKDNDITEKNWLIP
jgi:hypothetical protein